MRTPDLTAAQIVAAVLSLIGGLAGAALLDSPAVRLACVIGAFAVLVAWIIADAIIRHGRATGNVPAPQVPPASAGDETDA